MIQTKPPSLQIVIHDTDTAPEIYINGIRHKGIVSVDYVFQTRTADPNSGVNQFKVEYVQITDDRVEVKSVGSPYFWSQDQREDM